MIWRRTLLVLVPVLAVSATADDRDALAALYDALGGEDWTRSEGWMTDAPLGDWYGVQTVEDRVTAVNLSGNGLGGTLPYQVGDLSALRHLDLRWNAIGGLLPNELGSLAALETLLLTGNQLTGEIPWTLGGLSSVRRLDMSYNRLTGDIPGELGSLNALEALGLHSNELTGVIPWQLSQATRLKRLILNHNRLERDLPIEFWDLSSLQHVNVAENASALLVYENAGTLVDGNVERTLTAEDLLAQTTHIIEDEAVREFVREVMSAIVVQDGLFKVDAAVLVEGVDLGEIRSVIEDINRRLIEEGERLESLFDVERALDLHSEGGIEIPATFGLGPTEADVDVTASASGSGEYEYSANGTAATNGPASSPQVIASNATVQAGINCPTLKANWPHQSGHEPGYIVGNGSGGCEYAAGPPQHLVYRLYTYLEKEKKAWWIFTIWLPVDVHISRKQGVNLNPVWRQGETVARTPCSNGPGDFRTRLNLYITGSISGMFFPHPGTYLSNSVNVTCSDP